MQASCPGLVKDAETPSIATHRAAGTTPQSSVYSAVNLAASPWPLALEVVVPARRGGHRLGRDRSDLPTLDFNAEDAEQDAEEDSREAPWPIPRAYPTPIHA